MKKARRKKLQVPDHLSWQERSEEIARRLLETNADLICLQEVGRFNRLETLLSSESMSGLYLSRPILESSCSDGLAVFYNHKR